MDSRAQSITGLLLVLMLFRIVLSRSTTPKSFLAPKVRATNDAGISILGNMTKESGKNQTTANPAQAIENVTTDALPVRMRPTTVTFSDKTSRIYRCFHQGVSYRPGQEISTGQVLNWCFGSYCDYDGLVKHWDDFNCRNSVKNPINNTSATTGKSPAVFQSKPAIVRPATTQIVPTTTELGCEYRGKWFWPGETASHEQIGTVCFGYNCDFNSKLVYFEEYCPPTASPAYDSTTAFAK